MSLDFLRPLTFNPILVFLHILISRIYNAVCLRLPPLLNYPLRTLLSIIKYLNSTKQLSHKQPLLTSPSLKLPKLNFGLVHSVPCDHWLLTSSDREISHLPRRGFFLRIESNHRFLFSPSGEPLGTYDSWITFLYNSLSHESNIQPYLVSESIANIVLTSLIYPKILTHSTTSLYLSSSSRWLLSHLEYSGPLSSCNHLLNNLRAIYLYYSLQPSKRFDSVSHHILPNILRTVFRNSFYFTEGSIHYLFIITSWLHHIAFFSFQSRDFYTYSRIQPYFFANLSQCHSFAPINNLPPLGDISPDIRPDQLTGYLTHPFLSQLPRSLLFFAS